jgi:hypothetical protein
MKNMRHPVPRVRLLIILLMGFLYVAVLIRNLNESARRSLQVLEQAHLENYVRVIARIVEADVNHPQIKVHMSFRPMGNLTKDGGSPARNLKLFLNALHGPQEIDFAAGKPINPIEVDFPLEGDSNKYPFDRHQATLWLLLATPTQSVTSKKAEVVTQPPGALETGKGSNSPPPSGPNLAVPPISPVTAPSIGDLTVGVVTMEHNEPVPILIDLVAAVPGIKFDGRISRTLGQDVTSIDLYLRRTDNVMMVSICMMIIMACLALSLLCMVLQVTQTGNESTLLPLSLSVSLIFGLPALRNVQPSVPSVGVLGDYASFIWAELIVAVSTVMIVWTWIEKARKPQPSSHAPAPRT